MIVCSLSSTSSRDQGNLIEFCVISSPEVATPPALAAFPGPYNICAFRNTSTASGVEGMFDPSDTQLQSFLTSSFASSSFISFCVAQGIAISHLIIHGLFPSKYSTPYLSAYSFILPLLSFLSSIMNLSLSQSIPFGSYINPFESDDVTTFPPSSATFSEAN